MKKTIVLFPYLPQHYPVVSAWNGLCDEYVLQAVAANPGSGLCGHDVAYAVQRDDFGMTVTEDVFSAIDVADALFILSGDLSEPTHDGAIEAMQYALSHHKIVICAAEAPEVQKEALQGVNYLSPESGIANVLSNELRQIYPIAVPVIFVGSLFGQTDEDYVALQLSAKLKEKGLKISGYGTDPVCHAFGLHTYPDYLLNGGISDTERIVQFNAYLHQIVHKERPDVLVMQLPTPLLRFNDFIINSFGIVPYLIAQSVVCDYFVCCSANDRYNQEFWQNISKDFVYRYGHPIDMVHLSSATVNYMESMERKSLVYFRVSEQNLQIESQKAQTKQDIPVHNLLDSKQFDLLLNDIAVKLGIG